MPPPDRAATAPLCAGDSGGGAYIPEQATESRVSCRRDSVVIHHVPDCVHRRWAATVTPLELAVVLWPELADLQHLDGWRWQRGEGVGDLGEVGLCGYQQVAPSWMNVIWIFSPDDAQAVRSMIDGTPTWTREGPVAEVLTALVQVPLPGQPGAPLVAINIGLPVAGISD